MPAPMAASALAGEGHVSWLVLLLVEFVESELLHPVVEFDCEEFEPKVSFRRSLKKPRGMLNVFGPAHWTVFEPEQ